MVSVRITVQPSQLRQWTLGAGLELDQLKTDVHGVIAWESHDFLGGLRFLSVELKPGVVLYPMRLDNLVVPNQLLPELQLRTQFRQPGFVEARTQAFVRPQLSIFPLLVEQSPSPDSPVVGYAEARVGAGVDRVVGHGYGALSHNVQIEVPFAYKGDLDPALRTSTISYPSLVTSLDFRDDRIHPHRGLYAASELQVASGVFGSQSHDIKFQPELRTYLPLGRRITFATRAAVGFVFPSNYGDVVQHSLSDPVTEANRSARVRDIETTYFRGLFSGGSTSNRGYPIRGIAPHGVVPFLNPQTAAQQTQLSCNPSAENGYSPDPAVCSISIGGFSLWEFSSEVRVAVSGPAHGALFCDMSDVSPQTADIRLSHLHLSCGLGARYETPVGPIRLDVGYRVQPAQVLGFANEEAAARADPREGVAPTLFGLPVAVAFGIGEAF